MKSWHNLDALKGLKLSAHPSDSFPRFQEVLHRRVAEDHDYIRTRSGDLAQQKRFAHRRFFRGRRAVSGRPAAIDVADQDFLAFHSECFDNPGQQLTRATNKRTGLRVLIGSGRLAHKHQPTVPISLGVNNVRSAVAKRAARAIAYVSPDLIESLAGFRQSIFFFDENVAEQRVLRRRCRRGLCVGFRRRSFRCLKLRDRLLD